MNNIDVVLNTENLTLVVNGVRYMRIYGDTDCGAQEAAGQAAILSLISLCKEVVQ